MTRPVPEAVSQQGGATPATYHIDTRLGIVFTVTSGTLTDADLLEYQQALAKDPDFRSDLWQLVTLARSRT
ncbi:MAG: hypothetical protein HY304_09650 [candidate division Zixibacteria bacterium]|nr:hypothetical protein [candidate division Zixibacteria bacterium]